MTKTTKKKAVKAKAVKAKAVKAKAVKAKAPKNKAVKAKTVKAKAPKKKAVKAKTVKAKAPKKKAVKAKAVKAKTAKVKTGPSSQAQGGPMVKVDVGDLNTTELAIVRACAESIEPLCIKDIQKVTRRTNLQVRNGLRRPMRSRWLKSKRGKGLYWMEADVKTRFNGEAKS
jgi:hypothetical protein